jgi:hypothetical protein
MAVIRFPRIFIREDRPLLSEEQLQKLTRRPLQRCSSCRYVLCSCGNCHNTEDCNEECLYESSDDD